MNNVNDFIWQIYYFHLHYKYDLRRLYVRQYTDGELKLVSPPMDIFTGDIRLDRYKWQKVLQ